MADLDKTLDTIFKKPDSPKETMNYEAKSGVIGHVVVASVERINIPEVKHQPTEIEFGRVYINKYRR